MLGIFLIYQTKESGNALNHVSCHKQSYFKASLGDLDVIYDEVICVLNATIVSLSTSTDFHVVQICFSTIHTH